MLDIKNEASEEDFNFSLLGVDLKQWYLNILASASWLRSGGSFNSPAALSSWLYFLDLKIQRSNICSGNIYFFPICSGC